MQFMRRTAQAFFQNKKNIFKLSLLTMISSAILVAVCALSLGKLQTEYSMRQFQPKNHPLLNNEDKVKGLFQLGNIPPILALIDLGKTERGDWLEPKRIAHLRKLSGELKTTPNILGTSSIATIEGATTTKDGITIGKILEETPVPLWKKRVLSDPLLTPQLISSDARSVLLIIDRGDLSNSAILELNKHVRSKIEKIFPASSIYFGGIPSMQAEMSKLLTTELGNISLFALLAMILTLVFIFRNIFSTMIALYITAIANLVVLAGMAITGSAFTILSTTLPILVSVNIVSTVAYTMIHFAQKYNLDSKHRSKALIIYDVMKELFIPNLLAALTTCVGFAALTLSNVPLITQYGWVVASSVMVAWACAMIFLPPCLFLCPIPQPRDWTIKSARWSIYIVKNYKPIFLSLVVILAIGGFFARKQNWSAKLFDDMPKGHEARETTERIDKKMGGMIGFDVVLSKKQEYSWNDPKHIQKLDQLTQKWRKHKYVGSALALPDFIRAADLNKDGKIPKKREAIAEILFLYSMSEARPTDAFLTGDGRKTRISLRLRDIPANRMSAFTAQIKREAQKVFPTAKITTANIATTAHPLNNELSMELIYGFWQALLFIGILLVIVYRSFLWTITAIIPNLIPPLVLLSAMAIFETPIKPGIAIIFSIALGLAFNNTVYVLGRMRSLYRRNRYTSIPIYRSLYMEGVPCLLSTLPLAMGFLVFLTSYFDLNQTFGIYMLVSIIAGFLSDLVFLPTMLKLFPRLLNQVPAPAPLLVEKKPIATLVPTLISANAYGIENFIHEKQEITKETSIELDHKEEEEMSSPAIAAAVTVFIAFGLSIVPTSVLAATPISAKEILEKVNKNMVSIDEAATVKMRIIEGNGSTKDREMKIQRKSKNQKKNVLVRLLAPGDIRGTGLLSTENNHKKDQWLYLPSSKKSRRILSQGQGGNFLGSELSYEDMGGSQGVEFESKLLRTESTKSGKVAVIESTPKKGESAYSKVVSWIPLDKYIVTKTMYYDKNGVLLKIAQFSNYKKFNGGVWRAAKLIIKNVQNNRSTIMVLKGLNINKGIDDDVFTVASLEDTE